MKRKRFEFKEINELFKEINSHLTDHVKILLIGGGAMTLRNDKESTKDIDIVFFSDKDRNTFIKTLKQLGFKEKDAKILYQNKKNTPKRFS